MSTTSGADISKVIQLFDKIENSGNLEIEERSLKNIASKIQTKLLDVSYLANNHPDQIKVLISWFNSRFTTSTLNGLTSCIQIFKGIATKPEGKVSLIKFGLIDNLDQAIKTLDHSPVIHKDIEEVIKLLINDSFISSSTQHASHLNQSAFHQSYVPQNLNQVPSASILQNIPEREEDPSFHDQEFQATNRSMMSSQARPIHFAQTEFNSVISHNKEKNISYTPLSQNKKIGFDTEIKIKQLLLKETCELPFIQLSEEDERLLFDLGVQLKFGDFKNILNATQKFQNLAIYDFPIEVFLQRTDIIRGLFDLLEGAQGSQFTMLAQSALIKFVQRLRNLYAFLCDPNNKISHMPQNERDIQVPLEPYLEQSYPCNHNGRWAILDSQAETQKFGVSTNYVLTTQNLRIQNMSAAALQNSLSCRAALCIILTKSTHLLKDKEKIGLAYQLISETIETMNKIFKVEGNHEFINFIHLSLFAFDSVFEHYKDEIFEPTAFLRGSIDYCLELVQLLISMKEDLSKDTMAFSECFYENSKNLQTTLRRSIFKYFYELNTEKGRIQQSIIIKFFNRFSTELQNVNIIQQNVIADFERCKSAFDLYQQVLGFKIHQSNLTNEQQTGLTFIETTPQYYAALQLLKNLKECIELKLDFPFEHLLCDCIMYSILAENTSIDPKLDELETAFLEFLSIPLADVRERIVRKLYQKVRIQQAFSTNQQTMNNTQLIAKFLLRKKVLIHFVNLILIDDQVAQEQTKLQMTLGQAIIKLLIASYNEIGLISARSYLNSHFMTFQALMHQYPDLIALIDLIEENSNNKYLRQNRLQRDLFNQDASKRQFATSILRNNMSRDLIDGSVNDILRDSLDFKNLHADIAIELDAINQSYNLASFDFASISQLLMQPTQDFQIKRQCLEQLQLVLFDITSKRAKVFFSNHGQVQDIFSFIIQEILTIYNTCQNFLRQQVSLLEMPKIQYLNDCMKFLVLCYLTNFEEPSIQTFFEKFRNLNTNNQLSKDGSQKQEAENFQSSMVFFLGSQLLRKNALRLLQIILFHQVILKSQISKSQATDGSTKRYILLITPEFISKSFHFTLPHKLLNLKQTVRNDILLSEEQKMYVVARMQKLDLESVIQEKMIAQSQLFFTIVKDKNQDLNKVMKSFESIHGTILSSQQLRDELVSQEMIIGMMDMLKILPIRDNDYSFMADYFAHISSILQAHSKFEAHIHNLDVLVSRLSEGIQFHLAPFLLENVQSLFHDIQKIQPELVYSPKLHFIQRFLELLNCLIEADQFMRAKYRIRSAVEDRLFTNVLVQYLFDLFGVLKDQPENQRMILQFFSILITRNETKRLEIDKLPELLIGFVATHKLTMSLKCNSLLFLSLRSLLVIHDRRLLMIKQHNKTAVDIDVTVSLSKTSMNHLQKYQSYGWLIRLTESRDSRLRTMAWDLICELFDYELLKNHPSLVQKALSTYLKHQELYIVKISALKFLNHLSDSLILNCDISQDGREINDSEFLGSNLELVSIQSLLSTISKHGMISQISKMLSFKDYPLIFLTLTLKFLQKLVQMDYKKALPVLTQLDYWTFLVDSLNTNQLQELERVENRLILVQLKDKLIRVADPVQYSDNVYLCINSIMEFLYEAFRRDTQLANMLVKSTRLMQNIFELIKCSVDGFRQGQLKFNSSAVLAIFLDKCAKIIHCALLHPRDYTVNLLKQFLFEKITINNQFQPRNWIYLVEFYNIINDISKSSFFYGGNDIKLGIARFICEFLIRLPRDEDNFLDEMMQEYDGKNYFGVNYQEDLMSYGGKLLIEIGMIFKQVYSSKKQQSVSMIEEVSEQENNRVDISTCLAVLLARSKQAKTIAVEQNLIKKVIEICKENQQALILQEIQRDVNKKKSTQNKSILGKQSLNNSQMISQTFESQMKRKLNYVNHDDASQSEREVLRMLLILRHLFYNSQSLLIQCFSEQVNQSKMSSKAMQTSKTTMKNEDNAGQLFISLACQILEDQFNKSYDTILNELYLTLITYASQNLKFKNSLISSGTSDPLRKKQTLLKLIIDFNLMESSQSNSRNLKLNFTLLKSLNLSAEIAKEIMKVKYIEEVLQMIVPICKNEKDIKLAKTYICYFSGFLASYASTDEGQKIVLKNKQLIDLVLFILDTISVQNQSTENKMITKIFTNCLLFLRNASLSRSVKPHFLSNENFLPCLLSFLSHQNSIPRIKAYTAACLWMVLHNHQGVKQTLNRPEVVSELELLRQEYQRNADISSYSHFLDEKDVKKKAQTQILREVENNSLDSFTNKRMNDYTLQAITGILKLLQHK